MMKLVDEDHLEGKTIKKVEWPIAYGGVILVFEDDTFAIGMAVHEDEDDMGIEWLKPGDIRVWDDFGNDLIRAGVWTQEEADAQWKRRNALLEEQKERNERETYERLKKKFEKRR